MDAALLIGWLGSCGLFSPCPHLRLVTEMQRLHLHLANLLPKGTSNPSFLPIKAFCASRQVQGERAR